MAEAIKIRGHHLGVFYDVFARNNGVMDDKDTLRASISDELLFIRKHSHYGELLLKKLGLLLNDFFINRSVSIEIVRGLDDVCNSDCQELADEGNEELKELCCLNPWAPGDKEMLEIFGLEVGKTYSWEKIGQSLRHVWHKYDHLSMWHDIIRESIFSQIIEDDYCEYDEEEEAI